MQNAEDTMMMDNSVSEIEENANLRGSFVAQMAANAVRTSSNTMQNRDAAMIVEDNPTKSGFFRSLPNSQKLSLLCLAILFGLIVTQLIAAFTGDQNFIEIMTYIMSASYVLIAVAFIPLMIVCMQVTK
jgi:4-alpha-glucanotransferase